MPPPDPTPTMTPAMSDEDAQAFASIGTEPGWMGSFTRHQSQGAMPNGTPVAKCGSEPGDSHPDGTPGVVLGSITAPEVGAGYFVEWATRPRVAVFVTASRLRAMKP